MFEPKVSIIMPAYNAASYIEGSVDSVLNQSYKNWELLIIDDLSKDNTSEIAKRLASSDSRIRFLQKESNSGSAETRNRGISEAKGEYIAFLDSDDLWEPQFLTSMVAFMFKKGSAFSFASYRIVDENGVEFCFPFLVSDKSYSYRDLLFYNRVGLLTAMYHVPQVGKLYFDPSLRSLRDDYALWLDILRTGKLGYGNPEILARYRVRRGAATSNKWKVILAHFRMLTQREKLSPIFSFFLTCYHALRGLRKYRLKPKLSL